MTDSQEKNADERYDPAGERGGDTGPSAEPAKGPQAEKGDQRRDNPVHSGPTRPGTQNNDSKCDKRSGSDSNASR
ncbi:MAG: hypothetical protein H0T49_00930 [Chloroflexia bacterium]|jgi:hypothetical protein|nr:hypothetical protein [Chloroflexia bacterium]